MIRLDGQMRVFAACLSGVAGYVDALAFRQSSGFFVSFMSGNSTQLGVDIVGDCEHAIIAGTLVACFISGVFVGSITGRVFRGRRRFAVLMFVSLLLLMAAMLSAIDQPRPAIAFMAIGMGAENVIFEENGDVSIGLTYMTGTLVKAGQRLAIAVLGGDSFSWAPFLILWAGLVFGAALGGASFDAMGMQALWVATAASSTLAVWAWLLENETTSIINN